MSLLNYVLSGHVYMDRIVYRCMDFEQEHPEIFGVKASLQAENSWGSWWMLQAYLRILRAHNGS